MTDPDPGGPSSSGPPPGWQPPPPGWQPAPTPAPGYQGASPTGYPGAPGYPGYPAPSPPPAPAWPAPAPPGSWVPPRGMLGAAHKPGALPLRPLGLGDIYDAAFRIIRFNPKATVGSAVLVAAVAMAIPVLVTAVLTATLDLSLNASGTGGVGGSGFDDGDLVGLVGSFGSLGVGSILSGFGTLFVTGMIAHVTAAAAVGRRLSLGEAWAATRGKRWRLVGLAFLLGAIGVVALGLYVVAWVLVVLAAHDSVLAIVVWGLVTVPLVIAVGVWFWVRVYYLAVTALMLEPVGIWGSLRRARVLTRRQFWRTFGIALLTLLVVGIASQVLGFPIGLVGQIAVLAVPDRYALLALVLTQAVSQVVTAAFVTPFTSAVTSVQYLDQRMRKEAYDVELMQQAGITAQ